MSTPDGALSYGPRRVWLGLVVGISVLAALELLVGHLIVTRLLGPPWATGVDVVLIVATVVLTGFVVTPLWARPRLTADHLLLDFGGIGRATIPLVDIASVERFQPSPGKPIPPGAVVDGDPPVATFSMGSTGGHLRVTTHEPVRVRHSLYRRSMAQEFIVRLADPDSALAALQAAGAG